MIFNKLNEYNLDVEFEADKRSSKGILDTKSNQNQVLKYRQAIIDGTVTK